MELSEFVRQAFLEPWYQSLRDPGKSQEAVLRELIGSYGETGYGRDHGASKVTSIDEYRSSFPPIRYTELEPLYDKVRSGDYRSILPEPPGTWVMTRGSTGKPKIIPITDTHIKQVRSCGARAILNFSLRQPDSGV
ncbi:MAG: GH3 auxin-responsive promoter family protein, partial [Theionarchaea archaeon]|nr:GH3 auxin-responsive promoter family protein [Theionarchaea archaeon]